MSHPDILQVHGREDASVGPFILTEKAPRALTVFYRCLKFSDQVGEEVEVKDLDLTSNTARKWK